MRASLSNLIIWNTGKSPSLIVLTHRDACVSHSLTVKSLEHDNSSSLSNDTRQLTISVCSSKLIRNIFDSMFHIRIVLSREHVAIVLSLLSSHAWSTQLEWPVSVDSVGFLLRRESLGTIEKELSQFGIRIFFAFFKLSSFVGAASAVTSSSGKFTLVWRHRKRFHCAPRPRQIQLHVGNARRKTLGIRSQ